MISKNRLFERRKPSRSAKSIFIFCEGVKREFQYFNYFKEIDSRINLEIYQLSPNEDNSPNGLLEIAKRCIIKSDENPSPKYELWEIDEVWIVFDKDPDKADSRATQIVAIRSFCKSQNWYLAQSNPCFEVWLYYHFNQSRPNLRDDLTCNFWKGAQNELPGGFDSRKHPLFIGDAIANSKANYQLIEKKLGWGSTDVYRLGKSILGVLGPKIERTRKDLLGE